MSYNLTIIEGRVSRTPEIRPAGQTKVCKFSIAVNRKYKGKEDAFFIKVETWGVTAETAATYLDKGSRCLVEGYLKLNTWEKDGVKQYETVLVCEQLVLLDTKKGTETESQDALPSNPKEVQQKDLEALNNYTFDLPF